MLSRRGHAATTIDEGRSRHAWGHPGVARGAGCRSAPAAPTATMCARRHLPPAMNPVQEERERATSLDDVRIRRVRPLISPALLQDELPADAGVERAVAEDRKAIARLVQGDDRRLLA